MTPIDIHVVTGPIRLIQLHVANQSRTGVTRLQQIVAERGVLGAAPVHRALERVHVVDALAAVAACSMNSGWWERLTQRGEKPL
jgi:hypothetical protein